MWKERTELLLGRDGLLTLEDSTALVVGLGGVGAVAAEMLARAGVGSLIILDSDTVSETNKNRQLIALDSTLGRRKTEVVKERLLDINPELKLTVVDKYLTEERMPEVFASIPKPDAVVDAIDTLSPKLHLIKYCVDHCLPLVSSMGSGAKFDVTKIRITDISKSFNCPLAHMVRKKLRHMGISKGFLAVFSEELPKEEAIVEMSRDEMSEVSNKKSQTGTISYLPAAFGCACAQAAISLILEKRRQAAS